MEGFEIHSLDQRLGKFEGIQQQHDQRLANIGQQLDTIRVLIHKVCTERHREQKALRAELIGQIERIRTELIGQNDDTPAELNRRIDQLETRIDEIHAELNRRIDQLETQIGEIRPAT